MGWQMFRNKEYVLTIYREGGFTKAAEKLFVSQPSLSASVKRIEEKIGAPIFDRSSSPICLTEVGEEYVKYALSIEEKERNFATYISDHTNLLAGKIRIGGSSFFSSFVLPSLISEFNKKHSKINFEIFEDSTKNLMNKLSAGYLDLVIDNTEITDENIASEFFIPELLLLAVPEHFKINEKLKEFRLTAQDVRCNEHLSRQGVSLTEFRDEKFILLNPENDTGKRAEKLFKKHGVNPNVIFHLDQQVTAYNVSISGMGISFVSDTLVKNMGAKSNIYYYKLTDKYAARTVYFYRKKNHYLSIACRKFIEYNSQK